MSNINRSVVLETVKLPLYVITYYASNAYGWVEVQLHAFWNSALVVSGERHVSAAFKPLKGRPASIGWPQWRG